MAAASKEVTPMITRCFDRLAGELELATDWFVWNHDNSRAELLRDAAQALRDAAQDDEEAPQQEQARLFVLPTPKPQLRLVTR
jgi:hypothetical protein